jgi:hypothetical protein
MVLSERILVTLWTHRSSPHSTEGACDAKEAAAHSRRRHGSERKLLIITEGLFSTLKDLLSFFENGKLSI